MTTVPNYVTEDELRERIGSDTLNFPTTITNACTSASRLIENMTGRVFYDSGSVSARYYEPDEPWCCDVDDFTTTTGLIVQTDTGYDDTFATTFTLDTDFIVTPRNQIRNGQPWPYTGLRIAPRSTGWFPPPCAGQHETVKVTAQWGWSAVPDQVHEACLVAAAQLFSAKDAPDGFVGLDGWGPVRTRENPEVRALLGPYMLNGPVTVI